MGDDPRTYGITQQSSNVEVRQLAFCTVRVLDAAQLYKDAPDRSLDNGRNDPYHASVLQTMTE